MIKLIRGEARHQGQAPGGAGQDQRAPEGGGALITAQKPTLHPVLITIFSLTILFPRVGLPRNLCLIGSLTAAPRFSKGWVRKDQNIAMGIGCNP